MSTAFATQSTKSKPRKVTPLGKLLATYNELLGAWIVSGLPGTLEVRLNNETSKYQISFCGQEPLGFASLSIYLDDFNFVLKKQRILDYLSGKIDYLEKEREYL